MTAPDLTLVVTAHDETVVSGPTMRSADLAVEAARARGYSVQTIVALDAATPATREYFHQHRFDHWERRSFDERDLGGVRNAVLPETAGRFVAFLDADDLFSENWLAEALMLAASAQERGQPTIVHPELNVFFDAQKSVLVNIDQRSSLFTPYLMYFRNYYDALCLAPRDAYLEVPYRRVDLRRGIGYEDWQFAIETLAAGWAHVVARDTIIFKRRRDDSLLISSKSRNAVPRTLPSMAIDAMAAWAQAQGRRPGSVPGQ